MPISAGTTLGRYEVRSLLGAGGMGEVYLAHDTQLRRLVALKLLPAAFTQDEDRLRRFEQEAYAASAVKTIDIPFTRNNNLEWTGDGRAVLYVDDRGGVSNLWSQPIDGGPAKQFTQFKSDQIFTFDSRGTASRWFCRAAMSRITWS
jgi:serine/threonine protein kinase